jgi:hypothetical protein
LTEKFPQNALKVFHEVGTFSARKVAHIWHTNPGFSKKIPIVGACKLLKRLEAATGIEPMNKGFADLCLTTWLRRPNLKDKEKAEG